MLNASQRRKLVHEQLLLSILHSNPAEKGNADVHIDFEAPPFRLTHAR